MLWRKQGGISLAWVEIIFETFGIHQLWITIASSILFTSLFAEGLIRMRPLSLESAADYVYTVHCTATSKALSSLFPIDRVS